MQEWIPEISPSPTDTHSTYLWKGHQEYSLLPYTKINWNYRLRPKIQNSQMPRETCCRSSGVSVAGGMAEGWLSHSNLPMTITTLCVVALPVTASPPGWTQWRVLQACVLRFFLCVRFFISLDHEEWGTCKKGGMSKRKDIYWEKQRKLWQPGGTASKRWLAQEGTVYPIWVVIPNCCSRIPG